jgi:hypothetical protein
MDDLLENIDIELPEGDDDDEDEDDLAVQYAVFRLLSSLSVAEVESFLARTSC